MFKPISKVSEQQEKTSHLKTANHKHPLPRARVSLPRRHHVRKPDTAEVLGHLAVDLFHVVAAVGDQHLFHDGQLSQPATAHLHKLHEAAAGHLALAQPDGRQAFAALADADQLLVQGLQAVGAHHQLHQPGAVESDAAQHVFADRAAKVEVGDWSLLAEEGLKFLLVEEEVHDDVDLGRVVHQRLPAAALDGVEVRLAGVFAHHVDA